MRRDRLRKLERVVQDGFRSPWKRSLDELSDDELASAALGRRCRAEDVDDQVLRGIAAGAAGDCTGATR